MSNLINLVNGLKAYTVVIIENAFVYEQDAEKILAKFCFLPDKNRLKIIEKLRALGEHKLTAELNAFYAAFNDSSRDFQLEVNMPAVEYFKRYLNEIGATDLNEDAVIDSVADFFAKDETNVVKDHFLKYGIYSSVDEASYEELIQTIKQVENVSILIYKAQPSVTDLESFFQDINETITETKSKFCLAIIDKKLATGDSDNEGKSFIKSAIVPKNENENVKIICCLYTSHPEDSKELDAFTDFFVQEIGKNAPDKYEQIARTLVRSAYAHVFNMVHLQYQRSAKKAFDMVLKNQKNIKYIIQRSIIEGIPGFDAIKYWFNLAQQYQLEQEEIESLPFIAAIINFFDNQHLEDHPHIGKIGPELKKLNSFELFDRNVNKKFQPIAPGDIFQNGNEYFILMGQLCDIALRNNNTRKAKLAELLKLTFVEIPIEEEKYSITVDNGRKLITVQNFPLENGEYTTIKLEVSTATTEFADLAALDMVMFNEEGEARMQIDKKQHVDALKIMPEHLTHYYTKLQDKFILLNSIKNAAQIDLSEFTNENIKFSLVNFVDEGQQVSLGFKRVARLKGRYFDAAYNNFLNNKSRIDLNLIDNSPEYASTVKLTCSFLPDDDSLQVIENANLWSSKGKFFFKTEELVSLLPETFTPILRSYNTEIISTGKDQYMLTKNEDGSYKLALKYQIQKNRYSDKQAISYNALFNESKPLENSNFRVDGESEIHSFLNESGNAGNKITLAQLKTGVTVFEKKVHLQLVNGILNRRDVEEQN